MDEVNVPIPNMRLAEGFGDVETLFNSREWLQKLLESKGAEITGAGIGGCQADLDFTFEGCKYNVSIRPR